MEKNIFTPEELRNLSVLINLATIKGEQAITVGLLQQKLSKMLVPEPKDAKETKPETKPVKGQ